MMNDRTGPSDEFVARLTEYQNNLMGFIMASVGDYASASDILQQTNVVLLQKEGDLKCINDFLPWAITVAKFKILSYVRDQKREERIFTPETVEAMSLVAEEEIEDVGSRRIALRECLGKLPGSKVELLQQRYTYGLSLSAIADLRRCTIDSLKGRLKRIRKLLGECVDRRLTDNRISF